MWEIDERTTEQKVIDKYGKTYGNIRDIKTDVIWDGQVCLKITFTATVDGRDQEIAKIV